jgi:hypothetical protein
MLTAVGDPRYAARKNVVITPPAGGRLAINEYSHTASAAAD